MKESYNRKCELCDFVCYDKKVWFNHRHSVKHKRLECEAVATADIHENATLKTTIEDMKLELIENKNKLDDNEKEIYKLKIDLELATTDIHENATLKTKLDDNEKEIYKIKMDLELATFKLKFYDEQKIPQTDPSGNIFNININNAKPQQQQRAYVPKEPSMDDDAFDISIIDLSLNEMITNDYTPTQAFQKQLFDIDKDQRPIQYFGKELYVKKDGVWEKGDNAKKALNKQSQTIFANLNEELIENHDIDTEEEQFNTMKATRLIYDDFNYDTIMKGIKTKL